MSKVENTLICFLPEKVYFADFKGSSLLSFREKMRSPTADTLDKALDDVLLGETLGKNVILLDSELWAQLLTLPQQLHAKMEPQALLKTLSYETENFSGIPAVDSKIGSYSLGKEEHHILYWIVQSSKNQFRQIENTLDHYHSRFLGMTHPGGIPTLNKDGFKRIELWPSCVFLFYQAKGHKIPHLQILQIPPHFNQWEPEADAWFQKQGTAMPETLLIATTAEIQTEHSFQHTISLYDEAQAKSWLEGFAYPLFAKSPSLPLLKPSTRPIPQNICIPLTIVATFLAFLLCTGIQTLLNYNNDTLSKENNKLQTSLKQLDETKKKVVTAKKQLTALEEQAYEKKNEFIMYQDVLFAHRKRFEEMIYEVANRCPENLILQDIQSQQNRVILKGVCVQSALADQYANALKKSLQEKGWKMSSTMKVVLKNSKLWEFELNLEPDSLFKLDRRKHLQPKRRKLPLKVKDLEAESSES